MSKHILANCRVPSQNMQIQCNLAIQIDLYDPKKWSAIHFRVENLFGYTFMNQFGGLLRNTMKLWQLLVS